VLWLNRIIGSSRAKLLTLGTPMIPNGSPS